MSERIRFAIVGTSRRSDYLYAPLLKQLAGEIELVGVWGRSPERAQALGERCGVPWYTDLERLATQARPEAVVVSVNYDANGEVGRRVVEMGWHALLETPIAASLADADAIVAGAAARGLKVEVAEQYYRRPAERIKRALIQAGVFGRVFTAFNDFVGHGYHGMSLIRSYIGFDVPVTSVTGATALFETPPTYAWGSRQYGPRTENWEEAILRFAGGQLGVFNWTGISYDSPLRWARGTRFYAERGMAAGDRLALVTPDGKDTLPIEITRHTHDVRGSETLAELVAHTTPEVRWVNPFRAYYMDDETIAVADCVMSLVRAVREGSAPEYGPEQARLDQEVSMAMLESARRGGAPVSLPLPR